MAGAWRQERPRGVRGLNPRDERAREGRRRGKDAERGSERDQRESRIEGREEGDRGENEGAKRASFRLVWGFGVVRTVIDTNLYKSIQISRRIKVRFLRYSLQFVVCLVD
ncbi:hypothetical protein Syun_007290 [Stephania yunnanensis]|uniref:Uncharacterized protein n=1 Tax=Stephania yunnanensis TaxID=152371 RepID=A0AAP0L1Q7_9MAGN